jgi:hypothetical protein
MQLRPGLRHGLPCQSDDFYVSSDDEIDDLDVGHADDACGTLPSSGF